MRINDFLNEVYLFEEYSNRPLIVVDVQPAYSSSIHFNVSSLMDLVSNTSNTDNVLMLVNADETGVSDDTKYACIEYWLEHGLDEEALDSIEIIDKGFGYLRSWMDLGVDRDTIIKIIRLMYEQNVYQSEFLESSKAEELGISALEYFTGDEYKEWMETDSVSVGWLERNTLRRYNNCNICGGGVNECLEEVLILMDALNINYNVITEYVY